MSLNNKWYIAVQYKDLSILKELVFSKTMGNKNNSSKRELVWWNSINKKALGFQDVFSYMYDIHYD